MTQKYLRELLTLEKWSANWANTQSQLRRSVEQWERSYAQTIAGAEHTVSRERQSQLASSGDALLKAGVMPSAEQLAAMGMTAIKVSGEAQLLADLSRAVGLDLAD